MGRNHRQLFHDPITAPIIGFFAAFLSGKNPVTGAMAALIHTGHDSIDSALGGAATRRQLRALRGMWPLVLVALVLVLPALLLVLAVQALREALRPADAPSGDASPSRELEMFARARHREGMSRRQIAMQLIKRGCTWEETQELLDFIPKASPRGMDA